MYNSIATISFSVDHVDKSQPSERELGRALIRRVGDLIYNDEINEACGGDFMDTQKTALTDWLQVENENTALKEHNDLMDYVFDHVANFQCVPMTYEKSDGTIMDFFDMVNSFTGPEQQVIECILQAKEIKS